MISLLETTNKKPMSLKKKIGIRVGAGLAAAGAGYAAYKNKDQLSKMAHKAIKTVKSRFEGPKDNSTSSARNLHKALAKRTAKENTLARLNFAKGVSSGSSHSNLKAIKKIPSRESLMRHHAGGKIPNTGSVLWDKAKRYLKGEKHINTQKIRSTLKKVNRGIGTSRMVNGKFQF